MRKLCGSGLLSIIRLGFRLESWQIFIQLRGDIKSVVWSYLVLWAIWLERNRLTFHLPKNIQSLCALIISFVKYWLAGLGYSWLQLIHNFIPANVEKDEMEEAGVVLTQVLQIDARGDATGRAIEGWA